jgi:predicted phosphohydrolase
VRLAFISDLHVDVAQNAEVVRRIARHVRAVDPDVFIIGGDVTSRGLCDIPWVLDLFRDLRATRLFVAGNHDLWAPPTPDHDSRRLLYREIPAIAKKAGFHDLATGAVFLDDIAFVGTMGWYDYSFAPAEPSFPREQLRTKRMGSLVWQDANYAVFRDPEGRRMSDESVADMLAEDLESQVYEAEERGVNKIVAVTHHLPFRAMVPPPRSGRAAFFQTYLGSDRLGAIIHGSGRCGLALAGHIHHDIDMMVESTRAVTRPLGYPRDWTSLGDLATVAARKVFTEEI